MVKRSVHFWGKIQMGRDVPWNVSTSLHRLWEKINDWCKISIKPDSYRKMTLYKNKYRVESIRLRDRNYAANGWYFVTICTHNRIWYFGNVENHEMKLSPIGKIAKQFWAEIPQHSKHTKIDAYVIMPNHVHGIVIIDQPNFEPKNRDLPLNVSKSDMSPKANSLSVIIRSYKSSVTRWCRQNGYDNFKWQTRFYETILRQENSLERIQNYIFNNPKKWHRDKNNLPNLLM